MGKSNLEETSDEQNARRLKEAVDSKAEFESWCQERSIRVIVTNRDYHWIILPTVSEVSPTHSSSFVSGTADWWPSTSRLVFNRQFEKSVHANSIEQVKRELIKRWNLKP